MNFKEPKTVLHATGWTAVILITLLILAGINVFGFILLHTVRAIRFVAGCVSASDFTLRSMSWNKNEHC